MGLVPINDMGIPSQPPSLKSCKIGFLVQKDAQCSETLEKNNFSIFIFWEMVDFVLNDMGMLSEWMIGNVSEQCLRSLMRENPTLHIFLNVFIITDWWWILLIVCFCLGKHPQIVSGWKFCNDQAYNCLRGWCHSPSWVPDLKSLKYDSNIEPMSLRGSLSCDPIMPKGVSLSDENFSLCSEKFKSFMIWNQNSNSKD